MIFNVNNKKKSMIYQKDKNKKLKMLLNI